MLLQVIADVSRETLTKKREGESPLFILNKLLIHHLILQFFVHLVLINCNNYFCRFFCYMTP
nr:MAG TPA: hypothetical protein [Caudoviricetes sp.]